MIAIALIMTIRGSKGWHTYFYLPLSLISMILTSSNYLSEKEGKRGPEPEKQPRPVDQFCVDCNGQQTNSEGGGNSIVHLLRLVLMPESYLDFMGPIKRREDPKLLLKVKTAHLL